MVYHFKIVARQQVKQPDKPSKGIFFFSAHMNENAPFHPKTQTI